MYQVLEMYYIPIFFYVYEKYVVLHLYFIVEFIGANRLKLENIFNAIFLWSGTTVPVPVYFKIRASTL